MVTFTRLNITKMKARVICLRKSIYFDLGLDHITGRNIPQQEIFQKSSHINKWQNYIKPKLFPQMVFHMEQPDVFKTVELVTNL